MLCSSIQSSNPGALFTSHSLMNKFVGEASAAAAFAALGVGVVKFQVPATRPTVKFATCGPNEIASIRFVVWL